MITFAPFPIPIVVEGLGNAYVVYVKENNQWEDDEVCVALQDGGQWRHVTTSQIKSWNNITYGITKNTSAERASEFAEIARRMQSP